jgi:hypothetical protein
MEKPDNQPTRDREKEAYQRAFFGDVKKHRQLGEKRRGKYYN